jgi:hypothetical protein
MLIIDLPDDILIYISNFIKPKCKVNSIDYNNLKYSYKYFNKIFKNNYLCDIYYPKYYNISILSCDKYYCKIHTLSFKFLKLIFKISNTFYNQIYENPNLKRNKLLFDNDCKHYQEYVHFNNIEDINKFRNNIKKYNLNIKTGDFCCDGKGILIKLPLDIYK